MRERVRITEGVEVELYQEEEPARGPGEGAIPFAVARVMFSRELGEEERPAAAFAAAFGRGEGAARSFGLALENMREAKEFLGGLLGEAHGKMASKGIRGSFRGAEEINGVRKGEAGHEYQGKLVIGAESARERAAAALLEALQEACEERGIPREALRIGLAPEPERLERRGGRMADDRLGREERASQAERRSESLREACELGDGLPRGAEPGAKAPKRSI